MELIFLYVSHSQTGFINDQGVNLNSRYKFEVVYEGGNYILHQTEKIDAMYLDFFDQSGCIENVTAIVGENGSGKTTLLNELMISYGGVKDNSVGKEIYNFNKYNDEKRISIYIENEEMKIFHNIEGLVVDAELKDNEYYLNTNSNEIFSTTKEKREFENVSRFMITNTYLGENKNTISICESVEDFYMNPSTWHTLKSDFWGQKYIENTGLNGQLMSFSHLLLQEKNVASVQQFVDCIYLNEIISRSEQTPFNRFLERDLKISLYSFAKYFDNKYDDKDIMVFWHKKLQNIIENLQITDVFEKTLSIFYLNLLEFMLQTRIEIVWNGNKIETLDELKNIVETNINAIQNSEWKAYFYSAFDEIQKYISIFLYSEKRIEEVFDYHQPNLKRVDIILKYGTEHYKKFLNIVCDSIFSNGESFVIKCIDIKGLELSSGERALSNLFSWIHFLPKYKKIKNGENGSLHDNILILIDELDLYSHPAWQQKLVYYLLEELKVQFKGKRVQLIFSTHSPIVLSDIPRSNTIYLKQNEKRKMLIDKQENHGETFGTNIYKLFNDAFFLEENGQVGQFAKIKIGEIIKKIRDDKAIKEMATDEFDLLKHQIQIIGDNILREKLLDMLFESRYSGLNYNERKIRLYKEKIRELGGNII